ncbi:hypothetical protein HU985_13510 [Photobacterium damselae subsp. damselae]|uniref:hypothetical protein n=1 Tax=Photobacterium damselae TaxID=38293 RepID=UPI001592C6A5|nr:hypothetical protein [Photobacterium damselae]NVH51914.1 hypothetical protein [Photobacterium damselae subsp. damselae]NVO82696.1 hypothetical protein [Photobacterium damselae subsp. damselae]
MTSKDILDVVVPILGLISAFASTFAAMKTYKLSENLAKGCNLFFSVHPNNLIITATSTTERLIAHEILITVRKNFFQRRTYSVKKLFNLNRHLQEGYGYDDIFTILFERGLIAGESYEFPISELFKLATNTSILQENYIGLDLDSLSIGKNVKITFMLNGNLYPVNLNINQKLLDEILNNKTIFSKFRLKTCMS